MFLQKLLAISISASLTVVSMSATAADPTEVNRTVEFIENSAKKLGVGKLMYEWSDSPQVAELRSFSEVKRTAAIYLIIEQLAKNEEKIFASIPATGSTSQMAVTIVTRVNSYRRIRTLVGTSVPDVVLGDYLDGEIADLALTINGKMPLGLYFTSSKSRDQKKNGLLFVEKEFLMELVKLKTDAASIVYALANLTTINSLAHTCSRAADVCAKLQRQ